MGAAKGGQFYLGFLSAGLMYFGVMLIALYGFYFVFLGGGQLLKDWRLELMIWTVFFLVFVGGTYISFRLKTRKGYPPEWDRLRCWACGWNAFTLGMGPTGSD